MIDQEIVERVTRLPAPQRLELIELLSHSLREELLTLHSSPSDSSEHSIEEAHARRAMVERLALSLKLKAPADSSLWRVLGLVETNTPAPTDEELKEDYVAYLIKKYS